MKVLQINAVYAHGSTGTIVRDIEHICEEFGIECYVASPDKRVKRAKRGYVIGNIVDHKAHALFSRINGKQAYYSHIPTQNLCKWINEINPDIVHLHNLHSNYINLNQLLKFIAEKNIATVVTMHDCWYFTGGCFHYTAIGCNNWKRDCKKCPRKYFDSPFNLFNSTNKILKERIKYFSNLKNVIFVGVSNWITGEFGKSNLSHLPHLTIHNGIDTQIFKPTESTFFKEFDPNKKIIIGAANKWLDPCNHDLITAIVHNYSNDCNIVIFGCTPETKIPFTGIKNIGYIKDKKRMAEIFSFADVFINCSHEDSLPTVNLECQACGTPVIGYDNTGIPETLMPEYSIIVPTDDIKSVLDGVKEALKTDKKIKAASLSEWISCNFEAKQSYTKYIELYTDLIS